MSVPLEMRFQRPGKAAARDSEQPIDRSHNPVRGDARCDPTDGQANTREGKERQDSVNPDRQAESRFRSVQKIANADLPLSQFAFAQPEPAEFLQFHKRLPRPGQGVFEGQICECLLPLFQIGQALVVPLRQTLASPLEPSTTCQCGLVRAGGIDQTVVRSRCRLGGFQTFQRPIRAQGR